MGMQRLRTLATAMTVLAAGLTGAALLSPTAALALASETPLPSWGTGPLPPANPQGSEWQAGRVYVIARGGGRIFVGGVFTEAVPPAGSSASPVPRAGILALDAATGDLVTGFDAHMNGDEVQAIAVSPTAGPCTSFSDRPFNGSLGSHPPAHPIVSVAALS